MKLRHWIFALVLVLSWLLTGCVNPGAAAQSNETNNILATEQKRSLTINLQPEQEALEVFSSQDLGGNFSHEMEYYKVTQVFITVNEETLLLETALAQGKVTEEDIFYYARQDARAGVCQMEAKSLRGVTNFYFHYPEYTVKIIYDVLEAPDGSQPLISELLLYPREIPVGTGEVEMRPTSHFFDPETGVYLDEEDWGLAFEVQEVNSTGLTVTCIQSGGQQIGGLTIKYYYLADKSASFLRKAEGTDGAPFAEIPIQMGGTTTFTLDWSEWYGALPDGDYYLGLDIYDVFDEEQTHPLMVDFHDRQLYRIHFTL